MSDINIKSIIDVTMDKLRALVDADIVTGSPIEVGGMPLIPVSRVSFGMASGGSDFPSKSGQLFGGGGGAGVTVVPIAFMVVNGESVKMMPIYNELSSLEKAVTMAPEIIENAKELFSKKEKKE